MSSLLYDFQVVVKINVFNKKEIFNNQERNYFPTNSKQT